MTIRYIEMNYTAHRIYNCCLKHFSLCTF